MDNWTYRPWHLNTCSFRLICKPNWSSSLKILVKSFLFLFWKNMTTLRTLYWTQILENVPKPKKLSLCIYFCHLHQRHLRLRRCSGLIYLMLIIIKMSRPLWHFDMLFSTTKLGRTGSGYKCVCQFTSTQIYHYYQCFKCGQDMRRPLWCKIGHRGSRKLLLADNNDRWRCFPWKYHMERV